MRKLAFLLILCLVISLVPAPALAAEVDTEAVSAILMDANSGQVLFEKEVHKQLPPASVTKLMTLLVAVEAVNNGKVKLTDKVTTSENAWKLGGSQIYLEPGESFSLEQMLIAISAGSANDACVAVAEHISGTHEAFVEEMNNKAKELGLKDTHFVNAYGLPAQGHYTSAYDLAKIGQYALRYPLILKLTSIKEYDLREGKFKLYNTNKLLWWYRGADGFKTGWTNEASYCLASTVERDGFRLIAVVMGVPKPRGHFAESMKIFNWGFAKYQFKELAPANARQGVVSVKKGAEEQIDAVTPARFGVVTEKGKDKDYWVESKVVDGVVAPVQKGQKLGELILHKGNEVVAKSDLVAAKPIAKANIVQEMKKVFEGVFGY
jgi:serine-type D-Ala-D-Ala carboxypeptidase (penicillin-binding protein 5/6)